MADNWIEITQVYPDPPTDNVISGSVHEWRDECLIIEELGGKFAIFIAEKQNPESIIYEVDKGFDSLSEARDYAEDWMRSHPEGTSDV